MDSTKEVVKAASDDQQGFFQTVFKLDEMDKDTLMNLVQYAILAVIPSMVILKVLRNFVPEDDETKGSIEITGEVALEVVFIVISLWFMNRVIRYVPTYSGRSYPDSDPFTPLMPFLLVLFTLQSKLGSKKEQARGNGAVRVTQPLAGVHQPSQSDSFTTQNILPSDRGLTAMPPVGGAQMQPQQSPDFNDMYYNNPTPMPGAATPGMDMMGGPLAANEALGGFAKW
jgi:hypothetical protein